MCLTFKIQNFIQPPYTTTTIKATSLHVYFENNALCFFHVQRSSLPNFKVIYYFVLVS